MKIELVAKNYFVNEGLNRVINSKISKLDKFFEEETLCKVYLKTENKISKMEISFLYRGTTIRAEAKADNFYDAIDVIVPKLEKQISKHRTKLASKLKKGSVELMPEFKDDDFKIVKTKQFELNPQSLDEALVEFELLGHAFYVFCDSSDNNVKVLYLRDDGNIGLIEPIVVK